MVEAPIKSLIKHIQEDLIPFATSQIPLISAEDLKDSLKRLRSADCIHLDDLEILRKKFQDSDLTLETKQKLEQLTIGVYLLNSSCSAAFTLKNAQKCLGFLNQLKKMTNISVSEIANDITNKFTIGILAVSSFDELAD